jgi:iron complex outermembrane receptor protein
MDHEFTDAIMGYGSYSRGYKSGVFNLLPLNAPAVPPEVVDAYELGLKTTLLDHRMHLNSAIFWNNIEHLQTDVVTVIDGVATVQLASASKARTRGIEFSGDAVLVHGLTARFSGQYIDPKFVDFPNAPFVTPIYTAPYGLLPGVGNVSGFRLPQIPKYKLNIGFDYEFEAAGNKWDLGTNVAYRGGFPWEADNVAKAPALTLVNGNLTFEPSFTPHTSVRLWGKNLTNQHYFSSVLSQTGPAGFLASPDEGRTYGVEFGYHFQ